VRRPPAIISGHQRSSLVINGHKWSSGVISGHEWSLFISGRHASSRSSEVTRGHQRPHWTSRGNLMQSHAISCNLMPVTRRPNGARARAFPLAAPSAASTARTHAHLWRGSAEGNGSPPAERASTPAKTRVAPVVSTCMQALAIKRASHLAPPHLQHQIPNRLAVQVGPCV
jgi:hypothetical protein